MPNVVIGQPLVNEVNLIGDPFCFRFTLTGTDTLTTKTRFGYQLCDDEGNAISAEEVVQAKEGLPFPLNFQRDLRKIVNTPVPDCETKALPEMSKKVRLKTWESVFNKETCITTRENLVEYGNYTVINGADQYYGPVNSVEDDFRLMTCFPEYLETCGCQLIYFYSDSISIFRIFNTTTIRYKFY